MKKKTEVETKSAEETVTLVVIDGEPEFEVTMQTEIEEEPSAVEQSHADYEALLADPDLEQREVAISVREKFTDSQLAEKGEKLVQILASIDQENEDFAAYRSGHKARIETLEVQSNVLRKEIEEGAGMVERKAIETFLPTLKKAITRDGEGTVLSERGMTMAEIDARSQMSLVPMGDAEIEEAAEGVMGDAEPFEESTDEQLEIAWNRVRNGEVSLVVP